MSFQKVYVVGNLGRDPDIRYNEQGEAMGFFTLATNRQYTFKGEKVKETMWSTVFLSGKTAENCGKYLRKGSQVLVEGRMKIDRETGGPRLFERQDGTMGASFEIVAQNVVFLSTKDDHDNHEQEEYTPLF